jgi:hypothetical protein
MKFNDSSIYWYFFFLLSVYNLSLTVKTKDLKPYEKEYKKRLKKELNLELKDTKKYVKKLDEISYDNGWSKTFIFSDLISGNKYYKFSIVKNQSSFPFFGGMSTYNGLSYIIFDNNLNIIKINIYMGNLNKQKLIHDKDKYMDELVNDTVSFLIEQMSLKHYRDVYLYCDDYYKNMD